MNAEQSAGASISRRRFIQAGAAGAAAAALPAGASAQDGNTTDSDGGSTDGTTYTPPAGFIGDAESAIGVDKMLIGALEYSEAERTPDGFTEAVLKGIGTYLTGGHIVEYYDDPSNLEEAAGNGILQLGRMDSADHHVLLNMFNEIQLARNQAFFEGLAAFLENVEDGNDQATTVSAAETAGLEHYVTVQTNLATFWKEQINQLKAYKSYLEESFDFSNYDASIGEVLSLNVIETVNNATGSYGNDSSQPWQFGEVDVQLVDGSTLTTPTLINSVYWSGDGGSGSDDLTMGLHGVDRDSNYANNVGSAISLVEVPNQGITNGIFGFDINAPMTKQELQDSIDSGFANSVGEAFEKLGDLVNTLNMYLVLWDWIEQEAQLIEDNLNQVATNTYGNLQAGELTIEEFVQANPAFAASEYATDYESTGHYTYAAAVMASVGVAYNFEREMKVQLDDGSTLTGTMLVSNDSFSVNVGETVNPSNFGGNVYFAYSGETAYRDLSTEEYQTNVDGGVITLTSTPVEGTRYTIRTIEDEIVHLTDEDWVPVDESAALDPEQTTNWTYDASGDLDDPLTQVDEITIHYPDGTGAGMVRIENPFKILEAYNTETGEEVDEVNGEEGTDLSETETQFTEEDIEAFRQMVEGVNEDADPPGGGSGGGFSFGGDWVPDFLPDQIAGIPTELVLITGGGILAYTALTN